MRKRRLSRRTALLPFTPALYRLQSIYELDINLTTLRPTAAVVQSLWESVGRGGPLRPFLLMGNVEYVIVPGNPIRVIRRPTLPRYYFADQLVPIRNREEFVRLVSTNTWSDRVAFVSSVAFSPAVGEVLSVRESADAADLRVSSAGMSFLVISVTPHRYWRATIDGAPASIETANVGFQGLVLPPRQHNVSLRYRNPWIIACGALSLLSLIAAVALACFRKP